MLLKEETSNFLLWDFKNFKNEKLQLVCLRFLAAIWLESSLEDLLTNGLHYFNEREQDWTSRYRRVYDGTLQAMKHGSWEQPSLK